MTRRTFLKLAVIAGLLGFLFRGKAFSKTYTTKSIKFVEKSGNEYKVVFSDGSILSVNETGLYVLGRIKEGASINQIASELSKLSGKNISLIKEDIGVFLDNLRVLRVV
ncbi:MAG: PqqD family protein [candidate division WOR-3 bacterium]|nr:PqqD family protein [candidate division WOR-3 bacterium]MDW8150064.1 PqqD family protein [candidate division WOR-3 bacterium]